MSTVELTTAAPTSCPIRTNFRAVWREPDVSPAGHTAAFSQQRRVFSNMISFIILQRPDGFWDQTNTRKIHDQYEEKCQCNGPTMKYTFCIETYTNISPDNNWKTRNMRWIRPRTRWWKVRSSCRQRLKWWVKPWVFNVINVSFHTI